MTEDEPGTPPERPSGRARRSRRGGRSSESFDFQERFGRPADETGRDDQPADSPAEGLREPEQRDRTRAGGERLTVRELMEQMGMPGDGPQTPRPQTPRPQTPRPQTPGPATGADRPAPRPAPQSRPTDHAPIDQPPTDNDVTQLLPPVGDEPIVDLSAAATAERASKESRGQVPAPEAPGLPPLPRRRGTRPAAGERGTEPTAVRPRPATPAESTAQPTAPSSPADTTEPAPERGRRRLPDRPAPVAPRSSAPKAGGPTSNRNTKARRVATNTGRVLVALACVLSLAGTGLVWNLKRGWNSSWNIVAALNPDDPNVRNKDAQYGDETYLIVGTDSREGKNAKIGGGDEDTIEGQRADTILLVNIPADRSRVVAVSWPRDLAVDRPACNLWDPKTADYGEELYPEENVKINSVYAVGGPDCLVKTLTQISGLNINHFIGVTFEGFEKMVNAVGGVKVCSTVPLYDYELGTILSKSGTRKLGGKNALRYVRARNISAEGNGDYGRIKRQQLFLSSLLRAMLSGDVMSNPAKLNKIVKAFIDNSLVEQVDTDSLIELAESMQGMDAGRVTFLTIPTAGTATDGTNNEIPRTADIDAIFDAIIDDKPLPGEKKTVDKKKSDDDESDDKKASDNGAAPTTTTAQPTASQTEATAQYPTNMTVRVLNGSGEPGVAADMMNYLVNLGFTVPGVADASSKREDTVVRYGPGEQDSAATIAKMFPGARIQEDHNVKLGVEVILGADYEGLSSVASPPEPGSTVSVGQLPPTDTSNELPNDLSVTNAGDTTCS